MSEFITSSRLPEGAIWRAAGVTIYAKPTCDGGLSLRRVTDYDGGPARVFDVPAGALPALLRVVCNHLTERRDVGPGGEFDLAGCLASLRVASSFMDRALESARVGGSSGATPRKGDLS